MLMFGAKHPRVCVDLGSLGAVGAEANRGPGPGRGTLVVIFLLSISPLLPHPLGVGGG